jgi:hypothetical protein
MPIVVNLDVMLARRKMSLTELSERVGVTIANMSILKSGKAKAVRFLNIHDLDIRIVFQVFTQFGNIYIHAASIEIGIAAPDLFQGALAWQQVILMFGKHLQQFIFFGRKRLRHIIMLQFAQFGIEMKAAQVEFDIIVDLILFFITLQDRPDL